VGKRGGREEKGGVFVPMMLINRIFIDLGGGGGGGGEDGGRSNVRSWLFLKEEGRERGEKIGFLLAFHLLAPGGKKVTLSCSTATYFQGRGERGRGRGFESRYLKRVPSRQKGGGGL